MAEWLAHPTLDHKVLGLNPARIGIHLMAVQCFIALNTKPSSYLCRDKHIVGASIDV